MAAYTISIQDQRSQFSFTSPDTLQFRSYSKKCLFQACFDEQTSNNNNTNKRTEQQFFIDFHQLNFGIYLCVTMSLSNGNDDAAECPLCMEPLEVDDLNFYPCTCGYQICRFCWHRIRTDENELCPACRKAYPENPADFKPLSQEQVCVGRKKQKKKIIENKFLIF